MRITIDKAADPKGNITLITLTNASGASVTLSTLGAGIVAVNIPDCEGRQGNVVADYSPFDNNATWRYEVVSDDEVRFSLETPRRTLSYRWTDDNVLEIYYPESAFPSDSASTLGQTRFNLDCAPRVFPEEYLWINSTDNPDLRTSTRLKRLLAKNPGIALSSHISGWLEGVMNDAALLASHRSRRQLSINTSFPIIGAAIPASQTGITFTTGADTPLTSPQATFLHFSTF